MGVKHRVSHLPQNYLNTNQIKIEEISYAGFQAADESGNNNLFYWFLGAQSEYYVKTPQDIPLIVWLNGGPGSSSLIGQFMENGPFYLSSDAIPSVKRREHTWNRNFHMLYWDQPVGTGFSYTENQSYVSNEEELSDQFCYALEGFFKDFPQYRDNPLYLAGESYSGKYIPHIATRIHQMDTLSIKGFSIGDGWMSPASQQKIQILYAYANGLLDLKQRNQLLEYWEHLNDLCNKGQWVEANNAGNEVLAALASYTGNVDIYDIRSWSSSSISSLASYLNSSALKDAFHIPQHLAWKTADNSGPVAEHLAGDIMKDAAPLLGSLLDEGYRALFYTGNFDLACGFEGTEEILAKLDWRESESWNKTDRMVWVDSRGITQGFIKQVDNLTQMTIPNSGHLVPMDQPKLALQMMQTWINQDEFLSYTPQWRPKP